MYQLKDKVAIVTGGASGIGYHTVKQFLEKGAKVVLSDYDEATGEKATKELKKLGEVMFVKANVAKEDEVIALIEKTVETYGRLDVLFNNAGIGNLTPTEELTFEDYNNLIHINQHGVFFGSKYAIPKMREVGGGVIINTASILGLVGQPQTLAYNASKFAVRGMTLSLATEYAHENIRVNAVCPGYTESGMVSRDALGDFYDTLVDKHPIGRLGKPEEIAHAVVFLAENEFTTGTILAVDGGFTAQ